MAPDDGAVGAAKMGKKKKKKDDEGGKKTTKTDDDPFGKPDEYPDAAAAIIGSKHLVEFHERSDPTKTLATYSMSFGEKLLPREQVMCWQQIIVFNQMVGRMLDTTSKFAYHTDYVELLAKLCEGVKKVRSPLTCVVSSGGSAAGRASGRALPRLTRSLAALGPQSAPSRARGAASSGGIIHPSVPLPRSSAHPPAVRAVPPPAATCRLTLSLTVTQR